MSMHLLLSDISDVLNCKPVITDDAVVTGIVIDSRQLQKGNLFIALKGEQVDGHDYIAKARKAGATAALVSKRQDDPLPQLVVNDVAAAFAKVAQFWRQQCSCKIIAVTGSNGKTTVKEMIAAILAQAGDIVATKGNLNNDLGVPLTLARLAKDTSYAVIEMGTNHPGEIAELVKLVEPDVSVITNVGAAHLEGFNNLAGVIAEKSAIYKGVKPTGVGIVNADMDAASQWKKMLVERSVITFGLQNDADIMAKDLQLGSSSSHFMVTIDNVLHYVNLPLPGLHNVANALAAIAASKALNIPAEAMIKGLALMSAVPHRLQLRTGVNGSQLIDDSYNANPSSYQQALKVLNSFSEQQWLVLGDFGELGADSEHIHTQLGVEAKNAGVARLFTVGQSSALASIAFGDGASHFDSVEQLKVELQQQLNDTVVCLIKGSHFMQLDLLADALTTEGEQ